MQSRMQAAEIFSIVHVITVKTTATMIAMMIWVDVRCMLLKPSLAAGDSTRNEHGVPALL